MLCPPNIPLDPSPAEKDQQTVQASDTNNENMDYVGGWSTKEDSQKDAFQVSDTNGDKATFVFTGTSIRVLGRIDSNGMKALFELNTGSQKIGSITCQSPHLGAGAGAIPLYDFKSLDGPPAEYTLLITNQGPPLSLSLFEFSGGSNSATSTSHTTPIPSVTQAMSSTITPTPSSNPSLVASGSALPTGTTNQHTLPTLSSHTPESGTQSVASDSTSSGSGPAATSKPDTGGLSSYTVSSYTVVSLSGGGTTTIVIQTTVAVPQVQPYHGPSRGAVAGVAVGGLLFIFLLVGLGWWLWRRRRHRVRFLYGISNLDFDPTMMATSSAELQSQGPVVRDSDATLYGGVLPQYKQPESYSSLALDLKKPLPSEYATSEVSGDRRTTASTEPSTRSTSVHSLCDKHSVSGQELVERVVPLSKDGIL